MENEKLEVKEDAGPYTFSEHTKDSNHESQSQSQVFLPQIVGRK